MAFVATVTFKNGISMTGTGLTVKSDTIYLTGTTPSSLDTTVADRGGLPTGVANVDINNVPQSAAIRCPVGLVQSITVA